MAWHGPVRAVSTHRKGATRCCRSAGAACRLRCRPKGSRALVMQAVGRQENMVGWYHSHPGYGCWLSGIDVGTQSIQQQYQEPFLAIVVDPHRTIAAGKVEIGAFRTYPEVREGVPCLSASASLRPTSCGCPSFLHACARRGQVLQGLWITLEMKIARELPLPMPGCRHFVCRAVTARQLSTSNLTRVGLQLDDITSRDL